MTDQEWEQYDRMEKDEIYYKAVEDYARKEGYKIGYEESYEEGYKIGYKESYEEGFKEGLEEARDETIRKGLRCNIPVSVLAVLLRLSEEEIQKRIDSMS